jgi:hypothetical protein
MSGWVHLQRFMTFSLFSMDVLILMYSLPVIDAFTIYYVFRVVVLMIGIAVAFIRRYRYVPYASDIPDEFYWTALLMGLSLTKSIFLLVTSQGPFSSWVDIVWAMMLIGNGLAAIRTVAFMGIGNGWSTKRINQLFKKARLGRQQRGIAEQFLLSASPPIRSSWFWKSAIWIGSFLLGLSIDALAIALVGLLEKQFG